MHVKHPGHDSAPKKEGCGTGPGDYAEGTGAVFTSTCGKVTSYPDVIG
jgi:hypothetical protein